MKIWLLLFLNSGCRKLCCKHIHIIAVNWVSMLKKNPESLASLVEQSVHYWAVSGGGDLEGGFGGCWQQKLSKVTVASMCVVVSRWISYDFHFSSCSSYLLMYDLPVSYVRSCTLLGPPKQMCYFFLLLFILFFPSYTHDLVLSAAWLVESVSKQTFTAKF